MTAFPLQYSGVGKQEARATKETCSNNSNNNKSNSNSNNSAPPCKRTFAMVTPKKNTTPRKNRINLHTAIEDAQWDVVSCILRQERGVFGRLRKKNVDNGILLELDESRRTPLLEILSSSSLPPFDLIETIVSMEQRAAEIPDSRGRLPLHYAVVHKHDYRTIARLIDVYPAALCATDKRKKTALNYAMEMAQRKSTAAAKNYWMPSPENMEWQEQTKQIWSVVELLLVSTATYPQTSLNLINSTQKPMLVEALYHAASPSVISLFIGASVLLLSYENKTTAFAGSTLYLAISRHYGLPILSNLALQCPPDVYKVRDQTGMGLVAASYLSGVFNEVKNGEWCVDETFHKTLCHGIRNKTLEQCGPGILDWWTNIEFLIALCACGRQKKDGDNRLFSDPKHFPKQYLLHAALDNSDTPPMVVRILLALYPESIHVANPAGALPLHIAVRSEDYIPRNFELRHNPHTSMELVLQASDPTVIFRRYEDRLPLHHAISAGRNIDTLEVLLPEPCSGVLLETELSKEQTLLLQRDPATKLFPFQLAASIPVEKNPFRWTCLTRNQYSHHVWQGLSDRQKAVAVLKVSEDEELRRLETIYELLKRQPRAILGVIRTPLPPPQPQKSSKLQQQQKSPATSASTATHDLMDDDYDESETEVDIRSSAMMSGYLSTSATSKKTASSGSSLSQQSDSTFFAKALETETPERQRAPKSSLLMLFSQHKSNTANDDLYECDAASAFSTVDVMSILTTTIHTNEKSRGSLLSGSSGDDDDDDVDGSINIYSITKEDSSYDESSVQNSSSDFCDSFAGATYYSEEEANDEADNVSCASDEESMVTFEIRKFPRISGKLLKSSEHSKLVSPVRLSKSPKGKVQMSDGLKSFSFSSRGKEAKTVASLESSSNEKASVPSLFSDGYVSLQPGDLHRPSKEMLWMGSELLTVKKEKIVHHNEVSSVSSSSASKERSNQSKPEKSRNRKTLGNSQSWSRKPDTTGKGGSLNPKVAAQTVSETRLLGGLDDYSNSTDADVLLEDIVSTAQEELGAFAFSRGLPTAPAAGPRTTGPFSQTTVKSSTLSSQIEHNSISRGSDLQSSNNKRAAVARSIDSSVPQNKAVVGTAKSTEIGSSESRNQEKSKSDKYFDKRTMTWKIRSHQQESASSLKSANATSAESKTVMLFDKKSMKWVPTSTMVDNGERALPQMISTAKREGRGKQVEVDHFSGIPRKKTKPRAILCKSSQRESEPGPFVSIFGSSASRLPCIRCNNRDRQVLMIPCRHLCLCRKCAEKKENLGLCPLCNKKVADTMSIF